MEIGKGCRTFLIVLLFKQTMKVEEDTCCEEKKSRGEEKLKEETAQEGVSSLKYSLFQ